MKIELKAKRIDDEVRYFWWIDDSPESPAEGHESKEAAEEWYINSQYYSESGDNGRWRPNDFDRRSGRDRRDRYSINDRRQNGHGRRWYDKLK